MDFTIYPTVALYAVLGLIIAGFGVGMLVWQTGATQQALVSRRGMLVGGVFLILLGGLVLAIQIWATVSASYSTIP